MNFTRALIVVPAASQASANSLASSFAITPAQTPDFSRPICTLADPTTISHYCCCPDPGPELTAALPSLMSAFSGSHYKIFDPFDLDSGIAWLAGLGLSFYSPPS